MPADALLSVHAGSSRGSHPPPEALDSPNKELISTIREFLSPSHALDPQAPSMPDLQILIAQCKQHMNKQQLANFVFEISRFLKDLLTASQPQTILNGLFLMNTLLNIDFDETDRSIKFQWLSMLRGTFQQATHPQIVYEAAKSIGKLARVHQAVLPRGFIEIDVREALDTLGAKQTTSLKRQSAVFMIAELLRNVPNLFLLENIAQFFLLMGASLQAPEEELRRRVVDAVKWALRLIRYLVPEDRYIFYHRVYAHLDRIFAKPNPTVEALHGAILLLRVLLTQTGSSFMAKNLDQLSTTLLQLRQTKHTLIKRAIIQLLPYMASFYTNAFAANYLHLWVPYLLTFVAEHKAEHAVALEALGKIATSLGPGIRSQAEPILAMIHAAFANSAKATVPSTNLLNKELMFCLSCMVKALGEDIQGDVRVLLSFLFSCDFTPALVKALTQIAQNIPALRLVIQEHLFQTLSKILIRGYLSSIHHTGDLANPRPAISSKGDGSADASPAARIPIGSSSSFHGSTQRRGMSREGGHPEGLSIAASTGNMSLMISKDLLAAEQAFASPVALAHEDFGKTTPPTAAPTIAPAPQVTPPPAAPCVGGPVPPNTAIRMISKDDHMVDQLRRSSSSSRRRMLGPSHFLRHQPYGSPMLGSPSRGGGPMVRDSYRSSQAPNKITLALSTLATFEFNPEITATILIPVVVHYIRHNYELIKKNAIFASTKLLEHQINQLQSKVPQRAVTHVLQTLMAAAMTDPEPQIRSTVLSALTPHFGRYLIQTPFLHQLFMLLKDPVIEIRELTIEILGKLANYNTATILPVMRANVLEHYAAMLHGDLAAKEQSTRLLGLIIRSFPDLMKPYAKKLAARLIPIINEGTSTALTGYAISSLGDLATVAAPELSVTLDRIIQAVIYAFNDVTSPSISGRALKTFIQIESTGYVIDPFIKYPTLLDMVINHIKREDSTDTRCELVRLIGVVGALDPYKLKAAQMEMAAAVDAEGGACPRDKAAAVAAAAVHDDDRTQDPIADFRDLSDSNMDSLDDTGYADFPGDRETEAGDQFPVFSENIQLTSELFAPLTALRLLTRLLQNPYGQNTALQPEIIRAVTSIVEIMGTSAIPYAKPLIPMLRSVMRVCGDSLPGFRELVLESIAVIVSVIRSHATEHQDKLIELCVTNWPDQRLIPSIMFLAVQIYCALWGDFAPYLTTLLPHILKFLRKEGADVSATKCVLKALQTFDQLIKPHLSQVIPAILDLALMANRPRAPPNVHATTFAAVSCLAYFSSRYDLGDYAVMILHQLLALIKRAPPDTIEPCIEIICDVAQSLGQSFEVFVPAVQTVLARLHITSVRFNMIVRVLADPQRYVRQAVFGRSGLYGRQGMPLPDTAIVSRQKAAAARKKRLHHGHRPGAIDGAEETDTPFDVGPPRSPQEGGGNHNGDALFPSHPGTAWSTTSFCITKVDWHEWFRKFCIILLTESPCIPLRKCAPVAQSHPPLAMMLFNVAFYVRWKEASEDSRNQLTATLKAAFTSKMPPELLQTLLNLVEFFERYDQNLGIGRQMLVALAIKCQAFAKALYYKEMEFHECATPERFEDIIFLNHKLQLTESAQGFFKMIQGMGMSHIKLSWYERLVRWSTALEEYEALQQQYPDDLEITIGRMRCMHDLGSWHDLTALCEKTWAANSTLPAARRTEIATLALSTAVNSSQWDTMENYLPALPEQSADGSFYRAFLSVYRCDAQAAHRYIYMARNIASTELIALYSKSYSRAYSVIVRIQQLVELEEVMILKQQAHYAPERIAQIRTLWERRLDSIEKNVEAWQAILNVRSLVESPSANIAAWTKFANIVRKSDRPKKAKRILVYLLTGRHDGEIDAEHIPDTYPMVKHEYLKLLWQSHETHKIAFSLMSAWVDTFKGNAADGSAAPRITLAEQSRCYVKLAEWCLGMFDETPTLPLMQKAIETASAATSVNKTWHKSWHIAAMVNYRYMAYLEENRATNSASLASSSYGAAPASSHVTSVTTKSASSAVGRSILRYDSHTKTSVPGSSVTNSSGLTNLLRTNASGIMTSSTNSASTSDSALAPSATLIPSSTNISAPISDSALASPAMSIPLSTTAPSMDLFLINAMRAFIRAIVLSPDSSLQDVLCLITLWFKYGSRPNVSETIRDAISDHGAQDPRAMLMIPHEKLLGVIPQLIARIHCNVKSVCQGLQRILFSLGRSHPQALVFPLIVVHRSPYQHRRSAAEPIIASMARHSKELLEQATLVADEMIRVAILWKERWHKGLEEAHHAYFEDRQPDRMFSIIKDLHASINESSQTLSEVAFLKCFKTSLDNAWLCIQRYREKDDHQALKMAWSTYAQVGSAIRKQLANSFARMHLRNVSPKLLKARDLELCIPGTYLSDRRDAGRRLVKIRAFHSNIRVISSKQRPRKLALLGSDGLRYEFLLKGHEDLRQDERVMQLFKLVNTFLGSDPKTAKAHLAIRRFAIVPLSSETGLIEWVPQTDTMHEMIKRYRQLRNIQIDAEQSVIRSWWPRPKLSFYYLLTPTQRIEVFQDALNSTNSFDLHRMFYLRSASAEDWLERRISYTRSLALISVVGYILGLGDRHPNNFLISRGSGQILHIDFGDCFEVANHRNCYAERFPFRLTRMMVAAMEACGVGGTFSVICEAVLRVLRANADSIMVMLEAFVHDPLINWRLFEIKGGGSQQAAESAASRPKFTGQITVQNLGGGSRTTTSDAVTTTPTQRRPFGNPRITTGTAVATTGQEAAVGSHPASAMASTDLAAASTNSNLVLPSAATTTSSVAGAPSDTMFSPPIDFLPVLRMTMAPLNVRPRAGNFAQHENQVPKDMLEMLHGKTLLVMQRIRSKLTGLDFKGKGPLDEAMQVKLLIQQATAIENLASAFLGFCAYW